MIGCAVIIAIFGLPRLCLAVLWLFSTYTSQAFQGYFWPILGFIFMPWTTLAYLIGMVNSGEITGFWVVLIIIGVVLDLFSGETTTRTVRKETI
jgi:hypothetical protein